MSKGTEYPLLKKHGDPENPDSTSEYRSALVEYIDSNRNNKPKSCWDVFANSVRLYPDRPYLGHRPLQADGKRKGFYKWRPYKEVRDLAVKLGTYLLENDLVPMESFENEEYKEAREMRIMGVFMNNMEESFIFEHAGNAYDIATVCLYDTLSSEHLAFIMRQTRIRVVVCDSAKLDIITKIKKEEGIKLTTILIVDGTEITDKMKEFSKNTGVRCLLFWECIKSVVSDLPIRPSTNPNGVQCLCYTSGTSGMPKGVIVSHLMLVTTSEAAMKQIYEQFDLGPSTVHYSLLPVAHIFERIICNCMTSSGACIGVYSGSPDFLLEDLQILNPTFFAAVPRLLTKVYSKIMAQVAEKSSLLRWLFNTALQSKISNFNFNGKLTHTIWDSLVFNKTSKLLGSRTTGVLCGGAALDPEMQVQLMCIFCKPIYQGYGLTETAGGTFCCHKSDPIPGSVSCPMPHMSFKLVSCPGRDCYVTESPPRGELYIRGAGCTPGYFCDARRTKEAFTDGWFKTGDICTILPNGGLKIIDRKKDVFKLSQGEYIIPDKIESEYTKSEFIDQCFVDGKSTLSQLVGIIIPNYEYTMTWGKKKKQNDTFEVLCKNGDFVTSVSASMHKLETEGRLNGFEKIKEFRIISTPFTVDNGLMTPTFKMRRSEIRKRYQEEFEEMFDVVKNRH